MTAFGRHTSSSELGELSWEIRSVNHRYLDISLRLPQELASIEASARECIAGRLRRGKVEVALQRTASSAALDAILLDEAQLQRVSGAIAEVAQRVGSATTVDALRLLQWPGVIGRAREAEQALAKAALASLEPALDDFMATREREGKQAELTIRQHAVQFAQLIEEVRIRRPAVLARQKEKWLKKLAELEVEPDRQRLEQELVHAAQRLDVDEELDRLEHHVAELARVFDRDEPVGRRLDFLMQEFNREANTLASKAADTETGSASVDMKVLIEQMREQVQNIE